MRSKEAFKARNLRAACKSAELIDGVEEEEEEKKDEDEDDAAGWGA